MSIRSVDFNSTAYSKTKSFIAKENAASIARAKESRKQVSTPPSGIKSSWTPGQQELNEKLFDERKELVSNWFDRWSDTQRRTILEIVVSKCKQQQLQHIFSLLDNRIPITHVDFTRKLPRIVTVYIFSFLDPRSLCRCAQVCWYWRYLSELDQIWMPKCMKFNWILPFVPSPFEQGVWKRHYLECVKGLQYLPPRSPPTERQGNIKFMERRTQSMTSLNSKKNSGTTKNQKGTSEMPPWKGPDPHPVDITRRKASRDQPVIGCRRCHMSTHDDHDHEQAPPMGGSTRKASGTRTKPRIKPATTSFAPESVTAGTKFNSQMGRPDWAVQNTIEPISAKRPPAPVVRPSAEALGNSRAARHLPEKNLFQAQPWRRPLDYDSDG